MQSLSQQVYIHHEKHGKKEQQSTIYAQKVQKDYQNGKIQVSRRIHSRGRKNQGIQNLN